MALVEKKLVAFNGKVPIIDALDDYLAANKLWRGKGEFINDAIKERLERLEGVNRE